jgi:anti-sigma-K factor RskA
MTSDKHPDELLPWYANATLEGAERAAVEEHLRTCERCRNEVEFLRALRESVKAVDREAWTPGEFGWKRLQRDIHAMRRGPSTWWRPALAAAAAVVIVVQAALLVNFRHGEPAITPLGGPKPAGSVIQVQFQPRATEAQIRALLQQVHGTLVDGPGALGIYRVRLEAGEDLARDVERLRVHKDVVAHATAE